MNLLSSGVVLAESLDRLPGAVENLGYCVVLAAIILAFGLFLAALVRRYKDRRPTSEDPLPPHALLRGHTGDTVFLAFSPDGKLLATASNDDVVKVWDLTRVNGLSLNLPRALTDDTRSPSSGSGNIAERSG
jgi:WD40 repeat protein